MITRRIRNSKTAREIAMGVSVLSMSVGLLSTFSLSSAASGSGTGCWKYEERACEPEITYTVKITNSSTRSTDYSSGKGINSASLSLLGQSISIPWGGNQSASKEIKSGTQTAEITYTMTIKNRDHCDTGGANSCIDSFCHSTQTSPHHCNPTPPTPPQ